MFEYVRLKNFKSLPEITFDLSTKKNAAPNHIAIVYGENGVGKTNLLSSFLMLKQTLSSMDVVDILNNIISIDKSKINEESIKKVITARYPDSTGIIQEYKTIGSTQNMILEFGLNISGKKGRYYLEYDNTSLVKERLEFTLETRSGLYYEITQDKQDIKPRIFNSLETYRFMKTICSAYWGKHTFLSILIHEVQEKADNFILENISLNFGRVIELFLNMSCMVQHHKWIGGGIVSLPNNLLPRWNVGKIDETKLCILDKTAEVLSSYLPKISPEVQKAYYKKVKTDKAIEYELFEERFINGKLQEVPFELESTGIKQAVKLLNLFLLGMLGNVIIIDEVDVCIHDNLLKDLINRICEQNSGQFIMSTHNTYIMSKDSSTTKNSIYILNRNKDFSKEILRVSDYDPYMNVATNIGNKYHEGRYKKEAEPKHYEFNFNEYLKILELE